MRSIGGPETEPVLDPPSYQKKEAKKQTRALTVLIIIKTNVSVTNEHKEVK